MAVSRPASAGAGKLQELFEDLKKQAGAEKKGFGSLELCFCELGEIEKLEKIYKKEELQAKAWLHLGWDGAGSDKRKDVKLQEKNIGYALQALHTAFRKRTLVMPCRLFTQQRLLDANAFCFPVPRQNTGSVMNG